MHPESERFQSLQLLTPRSLTLVSWAPLLGDSGTFQRRWDSHQSLAKGQRVLLFLRNGVDSRIWRGRAREERHTLEPWCEESTQGGLVGSQLAPACPWTSPPLPECESSLLRVQGRWWVVWSSWVASEGSLTSPSSGHSV